MWKNGRSHGIGTLMYDGHLKTTRASASNDPLATLKPCTTYGRLLDATWINGSFSVYGSEMHATKRRPDGVMCLQITTCRSATPRRMHSVATALVRCMRACVTDFAPERSFWRFARETPEAKNAFVDAHNCPEGRGRASFEEGACTEGSNPRKKRAEAERKETERRGGRGVCENARGRFWIDVGKDGWVKSNAACLLLFINKCAVRIFAINHFLRDATTPVTGFSSLLTCNT